MRSRCQAPSQAPERSPVPLHQVPLCLSPRFPIPVHPGNQPKYSCFSLASCSPCASRLLIIASPNWAFFQVLGREDRWERGEIQTVKPEGRPGEKATVPFLCSPLFRPAESRLSLAPRALGTPPALIGYSNWRLRLQNGSQGQSQERSQKREGIVSLAAFYATACPPPDSKLGTQCYCLG